MMLIANDANTTDANSTDKIFCQHDLSNQNPQSWLKLAGMCKDVRPDGAASASATLHDAGVLDKTEKSLIGKTYAEKAANTENKITAQKSVIFNIGGIYFDGRKDSTLVFTQKISNETYRTARTLCNCCGESYEFI